MTNAFFSMLVLLEGDVGLYRGIASVDGIDIEFGLSGGSIGRFFGGTLRRTTFLNKENVFGIYPTLCADPGFL